MNEVVHFTKTPEIKHFAEVKVSPYDNVYGVTWAEVVKKYLQTAYSGEDAQAEVEAFGKTYKVLRRTEVTAFYDKDGNTLFDVTNERLADEYEWLTSKPASEAEETEDEVVAVPMGTTSLAAIVTGNVPAPTDEEVAEAIEQMKEHEENLSEEDNGNVVAEDSESSEEETPAEENGEAEKEVAQNTPEENGEVHTEPDGAVEENTQKSSVYIGIVGATTKLQEELKKAKEKEFAEPVIEYLIERCKDSESLAADICQDHKTWEKCYQYIYESARKKLSGKSGPVRSDIVFEWAEDYYRKDDKAEEEKKAKAEAEKKKKEKERKEKAATTKENNKARADYDTTRKSPTDNHKLSKEEIAAMDKKEAPKPKPKKNNKDMDGQMDLFSLMGM
jgi:hypothetical protein